jgi:hypothetical protein
LDDSSVPKWLPKPRIWLGIGREGVAGAAAILEARIVEAGGETVEQTAEDHAMNVARRLEKRLEVRNWLLRPEALQAAVKEFESLVSVLEDQARSLGEKQRTIRIELEVSRQYGVLAVLRTPLASTTFGWHTEYSNSLNGSALTVREYNGAYLLYRRHDEILKCASTTEYQFAVSEASEYGWVLRRDETEFYASEALADHYLKRLFARFEKLSRAREKP